MYLRSPTCSSICPYSWMLCLFLCLENTMILSLPDWWSPPSSTFHRFKLNCSWESVLARRVASSGNAISDSWTLHFTVSEFDLLSTSLGVLHNVIHEQDKEVRHLEALVSKSLGVDRLPWAHTVGHGWELELQGRWVESEDKNLSFLGNHTAVELSLVMGTPAYLPLYHLMRANLLQIPFIQLMGLNWCQICICWIYENTIVLK